MAMEEYVLKSLLASFTCRSKYFPAAAGAGSNPASSTQTQALSSSSYARVVVVVQLITAQLACHTVSDWNDGFVVLTFF